MLQSHLQNVAQVAALNVFDANGQLVNRHGTSRLPPSMSPTANTSDVSPVHDDPGVYVSGPLTSKATSEPTVYLARGISGACGEFLGSR